MEEKDKQFLEIFKQCDSFFKEALDEAIANQHLQISQEAVFYLLSILTRELRHDLTNDQKAIAEKAIAVRYKEALQAPLTKNERALVFRSLGDSSLVIAGMWWPSLIRKMIDVDYYIAIGSRSYQVASELSAVHASIFRELSGNFRRVTEILTEATLCISVTENNTSDRDTLKITEYLYKIYLRTQNPFFVYLLRSLDINIVPGTATKQ